MFGLAKHELASEAHPLSRARPNRFARWMCVVVLLLVVGATGAQAHQFFVIDEQNNSTEVPAGATVPVNLSGSQITIRVMNDGSEMNCTTTVTATVQGRAVGIEQQGGGLGSARTIPYTAPGRITQMSSSNPSGPGPPG